MPLGVKENMEDPGNPPPPRLIWDELLICWSFILKNNRLAHRDTLIDPKMPLLQITHVYSIP